MNSRIRATTDLKSGPLTARHRRTILAFTLVTAGLALAMSLRESAVYSSQARVLVRFQSSETASIVPISDRMSLDTERTLAVSRAVAGMAADRLPADGVPSNPRGLLMGLSVRAVPDTEILEFEYTDPVPEIAQERARAFAEAYLASRKGDQQRAAGYAAESVAAEVTLLEQRLGLINSRIDATRDETRLAVLEAQATTVLKWLVAKESELAREANLPPVGQIIEPADFPAVASGPNHLMNGLVGLIVGLVGGIGYAGVRFR
jgi:succinoglycan biosynthesis transport protein ExoP